MKFLVNCNKEMVGFKIIQDVELRGKRVLLRADYNVPTKGGRIEDDFRLRESLSTINYILKHGAKNLVIISHLGRPKGTEADLSLRPVAKRLGELLGKSVQFAQDCVGEKASQAVAELPAGGVLVLENLRFHPEEEKNDPAFAEAIISAVTPDIFVQDGFGVVHRAHASTEAITKFLPSVGGLLLAHEVDVITQAMAKPERPLTAVIGGAKIADKIDVIKRFIDLADCVAVGGALANDFLVVEGIKVGASLIDSSSLDLARQVLAQARKAEKNRAFNFLVPVDAVVSTRSNGHAPTRVVDLVGNGLAGSMYYPKKPPIRAFSLAAGEQILDIGPASAAQIAGAIKLSRTAIWSGTLGMAEVPGIAGAEAPFGHGTRTVVQAIIGASNQHAHKPFSIVGGGDTAAWVQSKDLVSDFNHVSTGGSSSLELMAGHKLPGIEALEKK